MRLFPCRTGWQEGQGPKVLCVGMAAGDSLAEGWDAWDFWMGGRCPVSLSSRLTLLSSIFSRGDDKTVLLCPVGSMSGQSVG